MMRKELKNTNKARMLFFVLGILLLLQESFAAITTSITPSKDTYVSFANPNTNYGTDTYIKVRANLLYPKRALIKFDLPSKPGNYTVTSAKLNLYLNSAPWFSERNYELHRMAGDWQENYVTWRTQPYYVLNSSSNALIPKTQGQWIVFDVTNDVKRFYEGLSNYGWIIVDSSESSVFSDEAIFNSKESPTYKPFLELTFEIDNDGDGYSVEGGDCNDSNPLVYTNATELCDNIDNDCDGMIDEDIYEFKSCGTDIGVCEFGTQNRTCVLGIWTDWSECYGGILPIAEVCGDGLDNDCNGLSDEENASDCVVYYYDNDSDGYGVSDSKCLCSPMGKYNALVSGDCNDANPSINPVAVEVCDGIDNNCNSHIDEGYPDSDHDGFADCVDDFLDMDRDGFDYRVDCDDNNSLVYPGAPEICDNEIDENCDGKDEVCLDAECIATNIPNVMNVGRKYEISITMKNKGAEPWTQFNAFRLGSQNPQDNLIWGLNRVEIAYGNISINKGENYTFVLNITAPTTPGIYACDWQMVKEYVAWFGRVCRKMVSVELNCIDNDNDSYFGYDAVECPSGDDCNDNNAEINPSAAELCDGIDNNCNGDVDEGCAFRNAECLEIIAPDLVTANSITEVSVIMKNTGRDSWTKVKNYKLGSQNPQDNNLWGLSRVELSDSAAVTTGKNYTFTFNITAPNESGVYNFSWKMLKEGVAWFGGLCHKQIAVGYNCIDNDSDGFYALTSECPVGNDCDDNNPAVNPSAIENCLTSYDDNCNGKTNERDALNCVVYYYDNDKDAFGTSSSRCYCSAYGKYRALVSNDCDDNNASINPNSTEVCGNSIDDNCDGVVDEAENAVGCTVFYKDSDGDSFGVTSDNKCYCSANGDYRTTTNGDCDDSDASTYPGAVEICDGKDNDCDGVIPLTEADDDSDGYRVCDHDCEDNNNVIYPGAPELCDESDNDCDGDIDEDCPIRDAACLGSTIPNGILAGETRSVSLTVKNLGRQDWTLAGNFRLGSQQPQDNTNWGLNRVDILSGITVFTGSNYTFVFDITAPSTLGKYNCSWQMLKEGVAWFGQLCNKTVYVVDMPNVNYTFSPSAPDGVDGWYKTKPNITLQINSTYNPGATGYYRWGSGTTYSFANKTTFQAPEGTTTLRFWASDSFGYQSPIYEEVFKVDSKSPTISAFRPMNGSTINNNQPHFWASYSEAYVGSGISPILSFVELEDPDGTKTNLTASFSNYYMDAYPTLPKDGRYNVTLGVADNAGNIRIENWWFVLDTTGPEITIVEPKPMDEKNYTTRSVPLNISIGEEVTRIEYSLNGGIYRQLCRYCSYYSGLLGARNGTNILTIRAYDSVGNEAHETVIFNVI